MSADSTQAKEILDIIRGAGERGITRGEISRAIAAKGCDCENWINTFLEAGIIEKCGRRDGADLLRFVK